MTTPLNLATDRLRLRWLEAADAAFILRLVNDPQWLRFIGDRQVSDHDSARAYLEQGPCAMYRELGFGLNRVALRDCDEPIGICGLLQRTWLPDCELGFALLPEYRGQGYASEAAAAVLQHGFEQLAMPRIAAIVDPANDASIRVLLQLGFRREDSIRTEPNRVLVDLYAMDRQD